MGPDSGYDDIAEGAQVVITDQFGATVAIGELEAGIISMGGTYLFQFTVRDVPPGKRFYGVEVSHRGRVQYDEAKLRAGPELSIGG